MAITVAIPFHNAENYLADAVKSVFAQTFQDWELLLINDGSTDNSLEIVKQINDPRVTVFSDGQNKKLAARLNEVTKIAKYDFIARMDADDLMSPHRLEVQYKILSQNLDIDLVSTGMYSILNNDSLLGYRGSNENNISFEQIVKREKTILHASILARKSWFIRNKYNEEVAVGQDTELWLRTSRSEDLKIKLISNPLYFYREEGNITAAKMLKAYRLERQICKNYIENPVSRMKFIARSILKTGTIFTLDKLNHLNFLLKRRNNLSLSEQQVKEYYYIINRIKKTKVPGLVENKL